MSNKAHYKWIQFINESQKPLFPLKNKPFGPMPSVRIDPENSHPDDEHDVPEAEAEMLLQKLDSETPAGGMRKTDRDFNPPMGDFKISLKKDSEQSFANDTEKDKEDKKAKDRIQSFWDVAQYTDTINLRNLEEIIREELIKLLNEAHIHREK